MKFSSKIERCGLSPMRKFAPYAVEAEKAGKKIYHLNIGQPDIETPPAYFEAVKNFSQKVLAYAPSAGVPNFGATRSIAARSDGRNAASAARKVETRQTNMPEFQTKRPLRT